MLLPDTLPMSGAIDTDSAAVAFQFSVADCPATIVEGVAAKLLIAGTSATHPCGGDSVLPPHAAQNVNNNKPSRREGTRAKPMTVPVDRRSQYLVLIEAASHIAATFRLHLFTHGFGSRCGACVRSPTEFERSLCRR
jgi:hypothetical protein